MKSRVLEINTQNSCNFLLVTAPANSETDAWEYALKQIAKHHGKKHDYQIKSQPYEFTAEESEAHLTSVEVKNDMRVYKLKYD